MTASPRPPLPLIALATGVLMAGLAAGSSVAGAARPVLAADDTVAPVAVPVREPVPLVVRPAAAAAHDPGDPATWGSGQLAAQLVFSCVQSGDLEAAVAQARLGIGGIVTMGKPRDAPGFAAGLSRARAAAPDGIAPLLASDEEGGRVQRLRTLLGPLPSAAVMGRWPDARIEQTAQKYGAGMRRLGVRLALSPVADLTAPGRFLTEDGRTFSADPQRVSRAAIAWSRGLRRAGVLSAVKHWPGHGYAADSHTGAPMAPPLATLQARDLRPFDAVLKSGVSVVMVGHLRSEGLTEPGLPATLSPNAMRVLRERAGQSTVLLTDSLSMGASSSAVGLRPREAAVRALQAGADWAMSCVDALGAVAEVRAALDTGRLSRRSAVASARRILELKQRLGLLAVRPSSAPDGALEAGALLDGVVTLAGRFAGPGTSASPRVDVTVDGDVVTAVLPDDARSFQAAVPAPPGAEVCAVAVQPGQRRARSLGCVTRP